MINFICAALFCAERDGETDAGARACVSVCLQHCRTHNRKDTCLLCFLRSNSNWIRASVMSYTGYHPEQCGWFKNEILWRFSDARPFEVGWKVHSPHVDFVPFSHRVTRRGTRAPCRWTYCMSSVDHLRSSTSRSATGNWQPSVVHSN